MSPFSPALKPLLLLLEPLSLSHLLPPPDEPPFSLAAVPRECRFPSDDWRTNGSRWSSGEEGLLELPVAGAADDPRPSREMAEPDALRESGIRGEVTPDSSASGRMKASKEGGQLASRIQLGELDLAREGDRPSAPSLLPTPASEMELSVLVRNRLERKKRSPRSARITSDDGRSDEDAMGGAEEEDATGRPPVLMV